MVKRRDPVNSCNRRQEIEEKLAILRERLKAYQARELEMLRGGVQSYGIGSRNVARYSIDLGTLRDTIKALEQEIAELEALLCGGNVRKAVGVVIRDW